MSVKFRARKAIRLGPLPVWLNFTQAGFRSWSVRLWRYTWNSRTRTHIFNNPGPGSIHHKNEGPR